MTISFCDLADFTTLSEQLSPEELVRHLGDYFGPLSAEILATGGTVDKYIGDAIMAFWGAPAPTPDHAIAACTAALRNQATLAVLRRRWAAEGKPELHARIGIHTGEVIVGNIGSPARLNYTVMGDPVNVASRLEGLGKHYGTGILIGEPTYLDARSAIIARPGRPGLGQGEDRGAANLRAARPSRGRARPSSRSWPACAGRGPRALPPAREWEGAIRVFERDPPGPPRRRPRPGPDRPLPGLPGRAPRPRAGTASTGWPASDTAGRPDPPFRRPRPAPVGSRPRAPTRHDDPGQADRRADPERPGLVGVDQAVLPLADGGAPHQPVGPEDRRGLAVDGQFPAGIEDVGQDHQAGAGEVGVEDHPLGIGLGDDDPDRFAGQGRDAGQVAGQRADGSADLDPGDPPGVVERSGSGRSRTGRRRRGSPPSSPRERPGSGRRSAA